MDFVFDPRAQYEERAFYGPCTLLRLDAKIPVILVQDAEARGRGVRLRGDGLGGRSRLLLSQVFREGPHARPIPSSQQRARPSRLAVTDSPRRATSQKGLKRPPPAHAVISNSDLESSGRCP